MAKDKLTTTPAQTEAPAPRQELIIPQKGGALSKEVLPAWMDANDTAGAEDIDPNTLRLPRLAIAQGLSKQLNSEESVYIDGLKMFDLFNDVTGQIYGRGPVVLILVRRDVRYIEFKPRTEGGGVIDLDVPAHDPRTKWTKDIATGKGIAPRATEFVEFTSLLVNVQDVDAEPERIVLSIKTTNKFNRMAADTLSNDIRFAPPIYKKFRAVVSKTEKKGDQSYGTYVARNGGIVNHEGLYLAAKAFRESLVGKTIVINRENAAEEPEVDDSMAANPEESGAPSMGE
jgi:hypothetical protein